jgi:hypothetical protein
VAVDGHSRIGLVSGQKPLERLPYGGHLALVECALAEDRSEPSRQKQLVAFTERNVEALGKMENHLAARPRTAGLDEAEMPRGDSRSQRELELGEVAPLPPLP